MAAHALDDDLAIVDGAHLDRGVARHAHFDVVGDAIAVAPAVVPAVVSLRADAPHAKRNAAFLALGAQLHFFAGAVDVGTQIAAHRLGGRHVHGRAVIRHHVHGAEHV